MFDEKTILARLQAGEDAQKIADEMAAMINAANKTYTDQKAKEEADRLAAKKLEVQKKEELQEVLDMFADWLNKYYGIDAKEELDADSVMTLINSVDEYMNALKDFEKVFGTKIAAKPAKKVVKAKSADETIDQFLKNMGW